LGYSMEGLGDESETCTEDTERGEDTA